MASSDYTPTLTDVGAATRTRTRDNTGTELGTFTSSTYPSGESVNTLIQNAVGYVEGFAAAGGVVIGATCYSNAQAAVLYRVLFSIELGFYPEQITGDNSPYDQFFALYEDAIRQLARCLGIPNPDDDIPGKSGGSGFEPETVLPQFGFPIGVQGMTSWMEGWKIINVVDGIWEDPGPTEAPTVVDAPFQVTAVGDGTVTVNGVPLTIKRAPANFNTGTNQVLVAAVNGKKIRVIWVNALAGPSGSTITFKSAASPISPAYQNGGNGGFVFPRDNDGIFETNSGEALAVDTTGQLAVMIGYVEV